MSFWHRHYVVKLCVHFVSMCHVSRSQKWTQTDTKVTFHHPPPTHPPTILWSYGTGFASIKRYDQFCVFTVVYKEAQIHPLLTLFILFSCSSFCSNCLPSYLSLRLLSACSPSLYSLSLCSLFSFTSFFTLLISSLYLFSALFGQMLLLSYE